MMEVLTFALLLLNLLVCVALFVKMTSIARKNAGIAKSVPLDAAVKPSPTENYVTTLPSFPIRFEDKPPNHNSKPIPISLNMLPKTIIADLTKLAQGKRYAILDMQNIDADLMKYANGLYGTPMINDNGKIIAHAGMELIPQQTVTLAACYSIMNVLTSTYHLHKIRTELKEIKNNINNLLAMEMNQHLAVVRTGISYQNNIFFWLDDTLIKLHFNDLQKEYYFHCLQIDNFVKSIDPISKETKNYIRKNINTQFIWHVFALTNIVLLITNISRQKIYKIELMNSEIIENITDLTEKLNEYQAMFTDNTQKKKNYLHKVTNFFFKNNNELSEQDVLNEIEYSIEHLKNAKSRIETNELQNEICFDLKACDS